MSRLRLLLLVAAAIAAGAAIGVLLLARQSDGGGNPPGDEPSLLARTSILPRAHLFGDPLVAELELLFDSRRVEPGSVQVTASFEPYEPLAQERSLDRSGNLVRLRYRF